MIDMNAEEKGQLSLILRNLQNRVKEVELTLRVLQDRLEGKQPEQEETPPPPPDDDFVPRPELLTQEERDKYLPDDDC